ncbi:MULTISPECIES: tail fiber assembly protein [Enterobacter cloacae complex]|uniref:tail fiber assembly protein n=1 Tax=Enterobacter cloacae complex TaxID=354276 RepID=UPI000651C0B2|nr:MULTISPECIES: tail assembly chaperone [Enterobacter cloacae complex]KLW09185.1 hypothetical protein SK45_00473 [Enterobacter hormaechei]KLW11040.1 hypothetical protein SK46_02843 [Enterobacter hormaechei]
MTYKYSPSLNLFFVESAVPGYEAAGWKLDDLVDVTDEQFDEFNIDKTLEGLVRVAGSDDLPEWGEIPPPTHEEEVVAAEAQKSVLISQANDYINGKQWPGKAALGRLKDTEKEQYNQWLDYLEALEAVDTSSAPDINWPAAPAA